MPDTKTAHKGKRINTRFFKSLLDERNLSQRQLARKLQMDPSAISLTFRGKREMKLQEAVDIAGLLGVDVADVLSNAGVKHAPDGERMVPVVGKLHDAYEVALRWNAKSEHVVGPTSLPENAVAIVGETVGTAVETFDGWTWFLGQPRTDVGSLVGSLVVAAMVGSKYARLGFLRKSGKPGRYNLTLSDGTGFKAVEIEWAAQVLWIKPV